VRCDEDAERPAHERKWRPHGCNTAENGVLGALHFWALRPVEDPRTTWGNTLAWNVQFGADTWSAKAYRRRWVFAADILRGFDVYRLSR
jgi:hypothetical protein